MNTTETQSGSSLQRVVRHGRGAYVAGCRCTKCCEANRIYQRDYLRNRVALGLVNHQGKVKVPNADLSNGGGDKRGT